VVDVGDDAEISNSPRIHPLNLPAAIAVGKSKRAPLHHGTSSESMAQQKSAHAKN
jgi:hypothetical protein